jgi:hypothetical protein
MRLEFQQYMHAWTPGEEYYVRVHGALGVQVQVYTKNFKKVYIVSHGISIQVNIDQLRNDSCIHASSFARRHTIPEFRHSTGKLIAPDR